MIWNKEMECMDRQAMERLQLTRLRETVSQAYERIPFYRGALDKKGVKAADIHTLADLQLLPFTTKQDLREQYPYGLFAVPLKEVVRVHGSSGTTGKPIVVGYTRNDMDTWTEALARLITQATVGPEDITQIAFGYGLFTGGFGLHYGMERVGATVVPMSSGNSEKQIMLMRDFGTTALVSTPSYALHLAEVAKNMGVDPKTDLRVRVGLFGGEPCSPGMEAAIHDLWGMRVTDNYGLTEVGGPGVSGDCGMGEGQHICEDFYLTEIIDPDTGAPLPYGEEGELVITTLRKEACPVLRYRTRDITRLMPEPCPCGRTTLRMRKIRGRSDDMLIIKGVNVFPSQIEVALAEVTGATMYYQMIVTKRGYTDALEIKVELEPAFFSDDFRKLKEIERNILRVLKRVVGIECKITLVSPQTMERTTGKSKRVLDLREF
ncbi:MAG: phenylacetate--CoA ligase [Peptococcaceae bacterium]|jgi:phenylacetate-CoA ligase|nr:phenylacetate--CoA ligase [Peptococcaceae bacterium]